MALGNTTSPGHHLGRKEGEGGGEEGREREEVRREEVRSRGEEGGMGDEGGRRGEEEARRERVKRSHKRQAEWSRHLCFHVTVHTSLVPSLLLFQSENVQTKG